MIKLCFYVYLSEIITDSMKHFFVTKLNNHDTQQYYTFSKTILTMFNNKETQLENVKTYAKNYNWSLNEQIFEIESSLALLTNFLILPQCSLILRNIYSYIELNSIIQKQNYYFKFKKEEIESNIFIIKFWSIIIILLFVRFCILKMYIKLKK